jgi:sugar O-acyltransferase (sialic acid O-acetyltransferase NeuD family)
MNLLVYCSGGFGKEVIDIARRLNKAHLRWDRIAFIDDTRTQDSEKDAAHYGCPVFPFEAACNHFADYETEAIIANGEPSVRSALLEKLDAADLRLATLIDPSAVVSETALIGAGCILFPGCFLSSMAKLGRNVAMVAGSLVGHDTIIGDNCVISGHVNIGGGCMIGSESYLGMGTQIKQQTSIGRGAVVGMGSVVFADIPEEVIALGNPCRPMRPNTGKRIFA